MLSFIRSDINSGNLCFQIRKGNSSSCTSSSGIDFTDEVTVCTIYLEPVWELNNYLSKLNCVSILKRSELISKTREALIVVTVQ